MKNAADNIIIRAIRGISEMRAVEDLQREVWAVNDRDIFPALALIPMVDVGAILIGAFDREELIGFVFGFPGIEDGQSTIHSDMLAVKSEYRSQQLGYRLKLAQRESALAKGIKKITWTFDPLQSVNAHLNFAKLGVVADRYEVNYYGETSSPLHRFGTDRLWVNWMIDSERVRERVERPGNSKTETSDPLPVLLDINRDGEPVLHLESITGNEVLIKIPTDLDSLIITRGDELKMRWRIATRQAFVEVMKCDFVVQEFNTIETKERREGCYVLRKRSISLDGNTKLANGQTI